MRVLQLMLEGVVFLGEDLHLAAWWWSMLGELKRRRYV
jgi:hypothetical protein